MLSVDMWLQWQEQRKVEHFRITYKTADGKETYRNVIGKDKRDEFKQKLKNKGLTVISCRKLYPFSVEKNQHNIELVHMVCCNTISDMYHGDLPYDEAEIKRLEALDEKAEKYRGLSLPVAWLPWEELEEVRELCFLAREHRANACIEAGRPDLVKYC